MVGANGGVVRGKGVDYDMGFLPGDHDSRPTSDQATVAAEMRIIAQELGCTAVRVSGTWYTLGSQTEIETDMYVGHYLAFPYAMNTTTTFTDNYIACQ
ncbi:MAG TPA: hypothetical protein VFW92_01230 [Candidatus Limnocylindrales bacterium]|nr:hypothetical protein [Candidatus Limnocylindrales bacterium]